MKFFIISALAVVLTVSATQNPAHVCLTENACANEKIVALDADYHCVCEPGFTGEFCDQKLANHLPQKIQNNVNVKLEVESGAACAKLDSQCVHGQPSFSRVQAVCA